MNDEEIDPTIERMVNLVRRGTLVELILQLNPIWKVEEKYGVSYQIVGIRVLDEKIEFRKNKVVYKN